MDAVPRSYLVGHRGAYPNMRWPYLAATPQCNRYTPPHPFPPFLSPHTIPATAPPNTAPPLSPPQFCPQVSRHHRHVGASVRCRMGECGGVGTQRTLVPCCAGGAGPENVVSFLKHLGVVHLRRCVPPLQHKVFAVQELLGIMLGGRLYPYFECPHIHM